MESTATTPSRGPDPIRPGARPDDDSAGSDDGRVLIVDDDPAIRKIHTVVLRRAGIEVDAVSDGPTALRYLHENDVSVVLLDNQMPGMSGPAMLREVRADPAICDVKVIFITSRHDVEDRVAGLDIGANDYLAKPVAQSELIARVRAQLLARSKESAIRDVVGSANDAHVAWSADGRITEWNTSASELFGWDRSAVVGRPFTETLLAEEDRRSHERIMHRFRTTGETPLHGKWAELTCLRSGGDEVPVEMTIWTVETRATTVFHALIRDVGMEKRLALGADGEGGVDEFVAELSDIVTMADSDGLFYVSPVCRTVLGYEPDDLIDGFPNALVHPDDRDAVVAAYATAISGDGALNTTFRLRTEAGDEIWFEASGRATRHGSATRPAVQAVWRDVSKRKIEEELRERTASLLEAANVKLSNALQREQQTVREMQRLDHAKSDFVSTVSHELRTPLTSIVGYLEMLRDDAVLDPMGQRALDVMERNAHRLITMVEDLLTIGEIDSTGLSISTAPTSMVSMVEAAVTVLEPQAAAGEIEITTAVEPGLPDVLVDRSQIDRVLVNLLSNAVKFCSSGGRVHLSAGAGDSPGSDVVVKVCDDGIGIAEEDQAHLFQRFSRTRAADELSVQGSGLGLFIVKQIVEAHGGEISLSSTPGAGTVVTLTLPFVLETDDREASPVIEESVLS